MTKPSKFLAEPSQTYLTFHRHLMHTNVSNLSPRISPFSKKKKQLNSQIQSWGGGAEGDRTQGQLTGQMGKK